MRRQGGYKNRGVRLALSHHVFRGKLVSLLPSDRFGCRIEIQRAIDVGWRLICQMQIPSTKILFNQFSDIVVVSSFAVLNPSL
jgi:hypothetical protein